MIEEVTPGIHSMSYDRYDAARGVSKSHLDILAELTPFHLWSHLHREKDEEPTDALRFGTILHRAMLEPDTYTEGFYVKPEKMSFATKDGKAWREEHKDRPLIGFEEEKQIAAMVSAVHTHPYAKAPLTGGKTEQSIFVEDANGVLRKSRLDALTGGNCLPDLKSVETANLEAFERNVSRYRYHVQAAYYLDNCKLAGIEKELFYFILVEKHPPYAVRCLQLLPEVIDFGRVLYQRDLQLYRNCLEKDIWPSWERTFSDCGLPDFEMRRLERESR